MAGMTEQELAEMEARCEATTEGPWELVLRGNTVKSYAIPGVCSGISPKTGTGAFLQHARTDEPRLIAEVRRLQVQRFELQAELAQAVILLGGKPCGYCGGPKNGVDHAPQCVVGRWERLLKRTEGGR